MGGFHIYYRRTNEPNYQAISSELSLPSISNMECDTQKQTYPEFFHGFYKGGETGLDVGIGYIKGKYKLFSYCFEKTTTGVKWQEYDLGITGNVTVTLKSYILTNTSRKILRTECLIGNVIYGTIDVPLSDISYDHITSGCHIHREISMSTNYHNMTGIAKFPWVQWGKSTLTDKNWKYHALTTSNSGPGPKHEQSDDKTNSTGFTKGTAWNNNSRMIDGFVSDTGWGDCTKV